MQSLSIVIPVYNEEDNIGPLVSRITEAMSGWDGNVEILFVDDGSKDRTLELLKEAQARDPRIRIAHFIWHLQYSARCGKLLTSLSASDSGLSPVKLKIPRLELFSVYTVICQQLPLRADIGDTE